MTDPRDARPRLGAWIWLKVAIAAALCALVFRRVDFDAVLASLARLGASTFVAALLLCYVLWAVNSYKWKLLLHGYGLDCRVGDLFRLNLASIFHGLALPGQIGGELVKAHRLGSATRMLGPAYASLALDRLTGLIGLALVGGGGYLLDRRAIPPPGPGVPVLLIFAATVIAAVAFLALPDAVRAAPGLVRALARLPASVRLRLTPWLDHARARPSPPRLAAAVLLSVVFQAGATAVNWLAARDLGVSATYFGLAWIAAAVSVVTLLPISIAGIGVREGSYAALLGLYGVPASAAVSLSLVVFVLFMALGLTGLGLDAVARPRDLRAGGTA